MEIPDFKLPDLEQILASAVHFLIESAKFDAASLLLSCELSDWSWRQLKQGKGVTLTLRGPHPVLDVFAEARSYEEFPPDLNPADAGVSFDTQKVTIARSIETAIASVLPADVRRATIECRARLVTLDPNWKEELIAISRGKAVHNQAVSAGRVVTWNNHRFRSHAETRVARAFEEAKVLFLPNCKARLGFSERENREPDFLVCQMGKWGILEVDGEPFHPPTRTVEDHERDRLFRAHGIKVVEHFDAAECFENAERVVKQFLHILAAS
ncbi:MAG: hypothetical protein RIC55_14070 [Pirellulaceae bacterium]